MLFIYRVLPMGGIETFFVRMAKKRAELGLSTSILLLSNPSDSNTELLTEIEKYAQVIFPSDIFMNIPLLNRLIPLLIPVKLNALKIALEKVDQIHVYEGMHALLGYRLSALLGMNLPVTVGFYHYIRYLWGGDNVALHEKINRDFIFNFLPNQSLLFFSEGSKQLYSKHKKKLFTHSNTFSLGVVDKKEISITGKINKTLRIVAVGRLVEFKTYNFYMAEVVKNLLGAGMKVQFDIYGDGALKEEVRANINKFSMSKYINLKGTLDYSKFDETVAEYDLFIGSGTAIIQASALGVPSIVGVENMMQAKTYGYFCAVYREQYNRKGLDLELISIEKLISEYVAMTDASRLTIKEKHVNCIDNFTNESCQNSFDNLKNITMPENNYGFNRWVYVYSYIVDMLNRRYNKNHPRNTQFESFRKLNEK
jgi:glycosyltransferase involved in cell wall biosynthesis